MRNHQIQLEILKTLLFNPNISFTDLNKFDITSMHFAYHLKTLITDEYVEKKNDRYVLTNKGKEYANRIDTEAPKAVLEKLPKVSVACHIFMGNDYSYPMVVQTRLKEPFYGYKGGITGKCRFGETMFDTAKREIFEETGLKCDLNYHGLVHHVNYLKGELVEDKFLLVISGLNPTGKLIQDGEGFHNDTATIEEFEKMSPIYGGELDLVYMCTGKISDKWIECVNDLEEF
jgi:hypothetical protein